MADEDTRRITQLLHRAAEDGNAKEELYCEVYSDLKAAANRLMQRQCDGELQATALVNEVVLRFEKSNALRKMENRRVFFSVALRAMKQVLTDHFRRRKKLVDGGGRSAELLDRTLAAIEEQSGYDFERLRLALDKLEQNSPRQHAVVMHKFFGGLTIEQISVVLEVSEGTVERDWRLARAKLFRRMREGD